MAFACARRLLSLMRVGPLSRTAQAAQPQSRERQPEPAGDELQELANTFRWTVARVSSLMRELETAHQKALDAEIEKKRFYRQVVRAVTNGKFELVDRGEIPAPGNLVCELPICNGPEYAAARAAISKVCGDAGMLPERSDDLLIAAGEAISNVLKHARDGCCQIYESGEVVGLRISDHGGGILSGDLPAAILQSGFSTKVSLGMGYTMMLELCDHVWLSTDGNGTTVQLEKRIAPVPPQQNLLLNGLGGR